MTSLSQTYGEKGVHPGAGQDMSAQERHRLAQSPLAQATAEIAVMVAAEAIRERRAYRSFPARAARGVSALWRSIASGGWE